jgi:hypothetical protein
MNYSSFRTSLFVLSILLCAISFSCKSSSYTETQQNDQAAATDTVAQTDINETQEDLMTVDYKQFYDELAPHGEWIEVTAADLKSEEEPTSAGEEDSDELNRILKDRSSSFPKVTFGQLFGVNDAVAADVNVGAFFVWRPDPSMAVSISAGAPIVADDPAIVAPAPMYRPYTNGQWVATDEGWYFKAPTAHEEIVHHYGRWAYSPVMGWVWVPGRVRSPAWVDWREDDVNIAWTPVPPEVYVVNNVIAPIPVYESRYVVVEKRYFVEPVVYQHVYIDRVKIKGMKKLKGIYVQNRVIYNQGPQYVEIERFTGRPIAPYKVVTVKMNNDFRNTWIENNSIHTFAPVFTKVKGNKNRNVVVTQPEKFNKFVEVWNRENRNNSAGNKVEDIGKQKESKDLKQENQKGNQKKLFDDSDMKTGKKNKENKDKINTPKRDDNTGKEKRNKEFKNREDKPKKEIKDNSPKREKREKSSDRPQKEKRDSKPSGNDNGHKEKRDKKNR